MWFIILSLMNVIIISTSMSLSITGGGGVFLKYILFVFATFRIAIDFCHRLLLLLL